MKKTIVLGSLALLVACGGGGSVAPSFPFPAASATAKPTLPPTPTPTLTPFTAVHVMFSTTPLAVATQNGTAAWQSTTAAESVEIDLPTPTTAFGLAYVCPLVSTTNGASNQEIIIQATTADSTNFTAPCPVPTSMSVPANISGTYDVSAIPSASGAEVYDSYGVVFGLGAATGSYTGAGAAGIGDLVALATSGFDVVGARILRNQNITNNAVITIPPFSASNASTTEPIALPPLLTGFIPDLTLEYVTRGGTHAVLNDPSRLSSYGSIPTSEMAVGDYYLLRYSQFTGGNETMSVEQTFTTPGPVSIVLPHGPRFYTVGATPFPTFTFDNASLSIAGRIVDIASLSWGTNPSGYSITAYVSQSWLGTGNAYALPNLATISGFFPPAASNAPVNWIQSSNIISAPIFALLGGSLPVGVTKQSVSVKGFFTEP